MAKTYSVLLQTSAGRNMVYLVDAINEDVAIDACVRSALMELPTESFRHLQATEIELQTPMKIMDSGSDV